METRSFVAFHEMKQNKEFEERYKQFALEAAKGIL